MSRYFIELSYKGSRYSGFQVQENAITVQSEVEKAFSIIHRRPVELTGSSRTDAGVHALQNYFHFDGEEVHPQFVYKMNALLPPDISIKNIWQMPADAHSRFDALGREYAYRIHRFKDPFSVDNSFFYPYRLDVEGMNEAAAMLLGQTDFFPFSKTNTQVKNFQCRVSRSEWVWEQGHLTYHIAANRFLRGMVRLVTGSLLKVGRGKMGKEAFAGLFGGEGKAGYSVPAHGLFLRRVVFPEKYFPAMGGDFTVF